MKMKTQKWLPVLPLIVILVSLVIFPLIYSLVLSFCDWNLMKGSKPSFTGISNYIRLVHDSRLHNAFLNTVFYVLCAVTLETLLGFGLALLLNKPFTGRTALLAFFLVPMSISPIAAALNWGLMLNATYGILNAVIGVFYPSYNPVDWLTAYPRLSIIMTDVWQWSPFVLLICLAGLQALPQEPYEAATLEGASSLQLFIFVTLPLMKPILGVAVILRTMDAIGRLFEPVYLLTRGGPGIASENLPSYIYEEAFVFWDMSYACAISFVLLIIVALLINSFVKVTRLEQ
jgi:multiple sugar transport system permease protein